MREWRRKWAARPTFFSRSSPLRLVPAAQGLVQPGPGIGPVAVGGPPGQPQGGGGILQRQAGEEAEFDQLGAGLILLRRPPQYLIQGQQIVFGGVAYVSKPVQIDPP